jgi:hypothetical protein
MVLHRLQEMAGVRLTLPTPSLLDPTGADSRSATNCSASLADRCAVP